MTPKKLKSKEGPSEGDDVSGEPPVEAPGEDAEGEDGLEGIEEEEEEQLFDDHYQFDSELKEYNQIELIFKKNNIPYDEEKLKSAIIWNNKVPDIENSVDYTKGRYPEDGLCGALMVNPYKEAKKAGKKKKKK